MSRSLGAVLAASLTIAVVGLTVPAEAAAYSSSGQRCTVVGTARADRLVGTSRNDVICGRGGNDVIRGGGGNDVIDGGSGADRLSGGTGNDRVLAGTGNDRVGAGAGDDRVSAGAGDDVVGGSDGEDRLFGGAGDDTLEGDTGDDDLFGNAGDDDLLGGAGDDDLDGGGGSNYCDKPTEERQTACATDLDAPHAPEVVLDRSSVDVTDAVQYVEVLVHAVDDTGVSAVLVGASSEDGDYHRWTGQTTRVSGTPRDGWWRARLQVPRFVPAATLHVQASLTDRLGRRGSAQGTPELSVINRRPDLEPPVVRSFSATKRKVDVRRTSGPLVARTRVTDDASGVDHVMVCAVRLVPDGVEFSDYCWLTDRFTGPITDTSWDIPFEIPHLAPSGTYAFRVCTSDRARNDEVQCWVSQAEADHMDALGSPVSGPVLPGGGAVLQVVGLEDDRHAPVLGAVTISPDRENPSSSTRRFHVDVDASDAEGLVSGNVRVSVYHPDGHTVLQDERWAHLESGTSQDGRWRVPVEVVRGTPPGRYVVTVTLLDRVHRTRYGPADGVTSNNWTGYAPGQATDDGYLEVS